jgi:hypothetical protein
VWPKEIEIAHPEVDIGEAIILKEKQNAAEKARKNKEKDEKKDADKKHKKLERQELKAEKERQ